MGERHGEGVGESDVLTTTLRHLTGEVEHLLVERRFEHVAPKRRKESHEHDREVAYREHLCLREVEQPRIERRLVVETAAPRVVFTRGIDRQIERELNLRGLGADRERWRNATHRRGRRDTFAPEEGMNEGCQHESSGSNGSAERIRYYKKKPYLSMVCVLKYLKYWPNFAIIAFAPYVEAPVAQLDRAGDF